MKAAFFFLLSFLAFPVVGGSATLQTHSLKILNHSDPNVPDWLFPLLLPYGSIESIHLFPTPNAPLVVLIQDAHGIEEAQKNTAGILAGLSERPNVSLVGLEGATGAFDFKPYRAWPNRDVTKQIADSFLKEGYLGGTEFAAITLPTPPLVWGVETQALYLDNIRAYQDAVKIKPLVDHWVTGLESQATVLKSTIYSEELKSFDRHVRAYEDQREDLGDFVSALFAFLPSSTTTISPNLHILLNASIVEKELDFKRVEQERGQLLETLIRALSPLEREAFVQKSIDVRTGRLEYGSFNKHLKNLCQTHGISLASYPQFSAYIDYVQLPDRMDRRALLRELEHLQTMVSRTLAQTPEQKALVSVAQQITLLKKLTHHKMTPDDWAAYSSQKNDRTSLEEKLSALRKAPRPSKSAAPSVALFEDFCRLALDRNHAMVDNLLAKMKQEKATTAFLVAGGFHTSGMVELLRQQGVSSIVVTPTITQIPKEDHSLDVFVRSPDPIEKLFAGAKSSLASWRLTTAGGWTAPEAVARTGALQWGFACKEAIANLIDGADRKQLKQLMAAFPAVENMWLTISPESKRPAGTYVLGMTSGGKKIQITAVPTPDRAPTNRPRPPLNESDLVIGDRRFSVRSDVTAVRPPLPRWIGPAAVVMGGALVYTGVPFAEIILSMGEQGMDLLLSHPGEGMIGAAAMMMKNNPMRESDDEIQREDLKRLLNSALQIEKNHLKTCGRVVDFTHYQKKLDEIIDRLAANGRMLVKKKGESFRIPKRQKGNRSEERFQEGILFHALSPIFEHQCRRKGTWKESDFPSLYPAIRSFMSVFNRLAYLHTEEGKKALLPFAVNAVIRYAPADFAITGSREGFVLNVKKFLTGSAVKKIIRWREITPLRPPALKLNGVNKGMGGNEGVHEEWLATLNGPEPLFDLEYARDWLASTPRSALLHGDGRLNTFVLERILAKLDATVLGVYFSGNIEHGLLEYIHILRSIVQQKPIGERTSISDLRTIWDGSPGDWLDRDHLLLFRNHSANILTTFFLTVFDKTGGAVSFEHVRASLLSSPEAQKVIAEILQTPFDSDRNGGDHEPLPPLDHFDVTVPVLEENRKQRLIRRNS